MKGSQKIVKDYILSKMMKFIAMSKKSKKKRKFLMKLISK